MSLISGFLLVNRHRAAGFSIHDAFTTGLNKAVAVTYASSGMGLSHNL